MTKNVDEIGPWSEEKLDLLGKYLSAYATIMNSQKRSWLRSFQYVDAFAGSVRPKARDQVRYIEGSPLRALRTEPPFDRYWFIDLSASRVKKLNYLQSEFPDRRIEVRPGNANTVLVEEVIPAMNFRQDRAFVFVDPYGLQIDWETMRRLASAGGFDVFVNFSTMGITRVLTRHKRPGAEELEILSRVMGGADWAENLYAPSPQLPLFGERTVERPAISAKKLANQYAAGLSTLFKYISNPVLMRNTKESPLYALFLASNNKTAVKITNDIFKRHERLRAE